MQLLRQWRARQKMKRAMKLRRELRGRMTAEAFRLYGRYTRLLRRGMWEFYNYPWPLHSPPKEET